MDARCVLGHYPLTERNVMDNITSRQAALDRLGIKVSVQAHADKVQARQERLAQISAEDRIKMQINGLVGGVLLNPGATDAMISAAEAKIAVLSGKLS